MPTLSVGWLSCRRSVSRPPKRTPPASPMREILSRPSSSPPPGHGPDLEPRLAETAAAATEAVPSVQPQIIILSPEESDHWQAGETAPTHQNIWLASGTSPQMRSHPGHSSARSRIYLYDCLRQPRGNIPPVERGSEIVNRPPPTPMLTAGGCRRCQETAKPPRPRRTTPPPTDSKLRAHPSPPPTPMSRCAARKLRRPRDERQARIEALESELPMARELKADIKRRLAQLLSPTKGEK